MRNSLMTGASRFAHFAGLGRGAAEGVERAVKKDGKKGRRAADDDDARADDDDDREEKKEGKRSRRASEDDDDRDDEKDGKKGRRASDDEDDVNDKKDGKRSRRASEDEDDDDDKKEGKKGRRAADDDRDDDEEDDDDDREMRGRSAVASARRRERARCAAIFATAQAAENPELAASLAFETNMTRQAAIAVLKSQAGTGRRGRSDDRDSRRQARNPDLDVSGSPAPRGQAVSGAWDKAHAQASGARPGNAGWADAHARARR
jgi:hypothetical protein